MKSYKPAIIVVTFNRPKSLRRLLDSILRSEYNFNDVLLIISIDYEDSEGHTQVLEIANEFNWENGKKRVIEHEKNLGLRNHIISCGNLSKECGSIIVLEDDIYVSPQFYNYSIQMLNSYHDKNYIAGVSLYKHKINVNESRPFYPENNAYDVFFMQFAQSWGQCWTYVMWSDFYCWYEKNNILESENDIPIYVARWPETSWLKFFIKYIIKNKKYFVYPYESLSVNFGDTGTHNQFVNNDFQVPLQLNAKNYKVPTLKEAVKYDAFFEREGLSEILKINDLCIDLYGTKQNKDNKRYWLTMEVKPYRIIKSFGLNFRPHELNIILKNEGDNMFLYDTDFIENRRNKKNHLLMFMYDYPRIKVKKIFRFFYYKLLKK